MKKILVGALLLLAAISPAYAQHSIVTSTSPAGPTYKMKGTISIDIGPTTTSTKVHISSNSVSFGGMLLADTTVPLALNASTATVALTALNASTATIAQGLVKTSSTTAYNVWVTSALYTLNGGTGGSGGSQMYPSTSTPSFPYSMNISSITITTGLTIGSYDASGSSYTYALSIPTMTAANAPSPYIVSESNYYNIANAGWHIFERNNDTPCILGPSGTTTGWVKVDLGSGNEKTFAKYALTANENSGTAPRAPSAWTIQGSNNDSSWTTLDTKTNQTSWTDLQIRAFAFANTTAYRYYKIDITANNGASYLQMQQLNYYTQETASTATAVTPLFKVSADTQTVTWSYKGTDFMKVSSTAAITAATNFVPSTTGLTLGTAANFWYALHVSSIVLHSPDYVGIDQAKEVINGVAPTANGRLDKTKLGVAYIPAKTKTSYTREYVADGTPGAQIETSYPEEAGKIKKTKKSYISKPVEEIIEPAGIDMNYLLSSMLTVMKDQQREIEQLKNK